MLQTSGEGALLTTVLLLIMEKVASLTNKTMWSLLSAENEGLLAHSGVNISRAVIEQFAVSLSKSNRASSPVRRDTRPVTLLSK